jgi:hypothetical protein
MPSASTAPASSPASAHADAMGRDIKAGNRPDRAKPPAADFYSMGGASIARMDSGWVALSYSAMPLVRAAAMNSRPPAVSGATWAQRTDFRS